MVAVDPLIVDCRFNSWTCDSALNALAVEVEVAPALAPAPAPAPVLQQRRYRTQISVQRCGVPLGLVEDHQH
jgi:hypothetical protein